MISLTSQTEEPTSASALWTAFDSKTRLAFYWASIGNAASASFALVTQNDEDDVDDVIELIETPKIWSGMPNQISKPSSNWYMLR
jgi:hypothetical protein